MVKYACKNASSGCLWSLRCARRFRSVCLERACGKSLTSSRYVGSNPTVRRLTYRRLVRFLSCGTANDGTRFSRAGTSYFISISLSFGKEREAISLSEQCGGAPCLRVDTALSQAAPKDPFRAVTEALKPTAATLRMNDGGIKRIYDGVII